MEKQAKNSYRMDMTEGPLTSKIIKFTIPVMLSAVLQLLFNTADVIVVGRFSGKTALAAVGSTGALINMLVSLFMGLAIGSFRSSPYLNRAWYNRRTYSLSCRHFNGQTTA